MKLSLRPPLLQPETLRVGLLLTGLVALGPLSVDMLLPSLPAMSVEFRTDPARVQLAVTLFVVGLACSQLFYGPLSDRYGRRKAMLAGLSLYTLAGVGCLFAGAIDALVAARILHGLAAGSGQVLARAVVRDVYPPEQGAKVMAYMAMATSLAGTLAPITGGFLQVALGWRAVFLVLAALGALFTVSTWAILPETNRHPDPHALDPGRMARNVRRLLANSTYGGYVLANTFRFAGLLTFVTGSSFVLIEYLGLGPETYGLCFGLVAFGLMNGAFLSTRLSPRLGLGTTVLAGTALAAVGSLTMAALGWGGVFSLWSILVPMVTVTVGAGMAMPPSIAGAIAPFAKMAGLASAVLGFTQMCGGALFAMAVGRFSDGTPLPMVTGVALGNLLSLAALLVLAPHRARTAGAA